LFRRALAGICLHTTGKSQRRLINYKITIMDETEHMVSLPGANLVAGVARSQMFICLAYLKSKVLESIQQQEECSKAAFDAKTSFYTDPQPNGRPQHNSIDADIISPTPIGFAEESLDG